MCLGQVRSVLNCGLKSVQGCGPAPLAAELVAQLSLCPSSQAPYSPRQALHCGRPFPVCPRRLTLPSSGLACGQPLKSNVRRHLKALVREPLPRVGRRVVLRRLGREDLSAFQAYRTDEAVGRYQGWLVQIDAHALAFIEEMSHAVLFPSGSWVQLAVAETNSNELIGDVGVCVATDGKSAELGFTISPRFQGRGLGTEALLEAIALVFKLSSAVQAICVTDARNTPSIRLLERAGMQRTASAEAVFRGEHCIEHTYSILRHDGA